MNNIECTEDGIVLQQGMAGEVKLQALTDAHWTTNVHDRRSVSGVMVFIGNVPAVFKSKYSRAVALSFAEAEHMALSSCTQEVF